MKCPYCPAPGPCIGERNPGICRRVIDGDGDGGFLATIARPGVPPIAAPAEAERLLAMFCPHQRLLDCRCDDYQCSPAGRRPGERVSVADCRACLRWDRPPPTDRDVVLAFVAAGADPTEVAGRTERTRSMAKRSGDPERFWAAWAGFLTEQELA